MGESTRDAIEPEQTQPAITRKAGILVSDRTNRRLLESIACTLELTPIILPSEVLEAQQACEFELIIADEPMARKLRPELGKKNKG